MRARARELVSQGDALFADRAPILSLWQQLCENVHVMRADYTRKRYFSEEFASYLMTGRPAMACRDFTNSIGALMRRPDQQWLWARTQDERLNSARAPRAYLDWRSEQQYRAMYAATSGLVRACKEVDGDYASIGNAVIRVEANEDRTGLLVRSRHPRDVVWAEGHGGAIDEIHDKYELSVRDICRIYPTKRSDKVAEALAKEPNKKVNCRRIIVPSGEYDLPIRNKRRFPFVTITIDVDNETLLEEVPARRKGYVIPRWATISGVQYAYSLAAVYALPDARMLQQITLTMLEAAQKATDPPMIAVGEAIQGGVNVGASMITWTDADYDERTGEVLRPMQLRFDGIKFGAEREERIEGMIDGAFYLNQIRFPQITKEMTAFEASKLYEEFTRNNLPLLEPIKSEYNAPLCSECSEALDEIGYFAAKGVPTADIPRELMGQEIRWEFDTPLRAAAEQAKIFAFSQACDITAKAAQIDPTAPMNLDVNAGLRESLIGAGAARWLVDADKVEQLKEQHAAQQQAVTAANAMAHGADAATRVATAVKSSGEAAQAMQGAAA